MERIGITPRQEDSDLVTSLDLIREAEALGYHSVWLGESWGREVFTSLAYFALGTQRIQLGAGIVNVYSRTPALIGMAAATLDEVSGGRFILGLGVSGQIVIEQWHGVPFHHPLERTREYVEILRLIWSGQRVNYQGRVFRLQNFRLAFTPRRAHLPIFIAAMGPQNLRLTGELADGCIPFLPSRSRFREVYLKPLEEGAAARGRSLSHIEIAPYIITAVSADGASARALARAHVAYYIGGMGVYYNTLVRRYGYVEEAEAIRQAWQHRDRERAARLVSDTMLDDLALAGTPAQCREGLEAYRGAGVTLPILAFAHGSSREMVREALRTFAPKG
ncbi:MAG: LLM class flavin-dependent oxidoreductase [Dehalococcoidia bacterium]|nr:LLM class flavin-dependent oxidoreductase [Dehalococcoidia bacterium]MDW8120150.1 LLM class flavin-dependent oxidoreductase [Chloroflexota bacterium]